MADYTPEQVEKLAEFARRTHRIALSADHANLAELGLENPDGTLADWLRGEDWADRAAAEAWPYGTPADRVRLAAIIRRHAEDRT